MIDLLRLQNQLMQSEEYIEDILQALGFENVRKCNKYYAFANKDGDNQSANTLYLDTLKYFNWTRGYNGNIFTLVMHERGCTLGQAARWISKQTGIEIHKILNVRLPFGGFYKKLLNDVDYEDNEEYIYKETDLPPADALSRKFLNDGIPLITQEQWGVRYSHEDDAVLIPIHNYTGELVGCKARSNDAKCTIDRRWWAYFPYKKSQYLYGWYKNYQKIQEKETVIIVEAEKSVMVLDGWGCKLGLGIGGHSISRIQVRYIKSLMAKTVIVAFDQGLREDEIRLETEKLMPRHHFFNTKIGYIFDEKEEILNKDSKDAPVDLGISSFKKLMKRYVRWIEV